MHIHKPIEEKLIRQTFKDLIGKITQLPPKKSAVKRQWREREVYYIDILEINNQDILFKIGCQAGTYIRKFCLFPNTEIITYKGIKKIEEICNNNLNLQTFSYNQSKIVKNKIIDFQKIPFSGKLIELKTSSGIPLKITPDHELLVSTINGPIMKRANEIKKGDFLFRSINLPLLIRKRHVSELVDDEYLIHDNNIKNKCKIAIIKKFGGIRAFSRTKNIDRKVFLKNSKNDIKIKHLKLAGIFNKIKNNLNCFKTEKGKIIKVKPELTENLLYIVGLVASDGNNTKEKNTIRYTRIKFHNVQKILIDKFYNLTKKVFPNIKVTKKLITRNLWQVETSNSLFATLCANLGVISPSKNGDFLPILELDKKLLASFLKGYFDGDGNTYFKVKNNKKKGVYSEITLSSVNFINIKRIHQMLLKLGIQSRIVKRKISGKRFSSKNDYIYDVKLIDPISKIWFSKLIGSNHPIKRRILKKIKNYFNKLNQEPSDYLYCSLDKLNYLKIKSLSYKIGGNGDRLKKENIPMTRYIYKRLNSLNKKVPNLLEEFTIENVNSIKKIPHEGFVYDITVENDHNFLIENGVVSSNCFDFGRKLNTQAHMAQLLRTKAGSFKIEDSITLYDLKDAYEYYKQGDESLLKKYILPIESAVVSLPKVYVLDSSVDSLCHGASLSTPGISELESNIKENDLVAILTLKGELICLGTAFMSSEKILKEKRALAIKTTKVFMSPGIYPKYSPLKKEL